MVKYAVIVRTDSYAGNFERELCAHLTGTVGECYVGMKYVDSAVSELFYEDVEQKPDEHGTHRPVSLGIDLDYTNMDVVIWFRNKPTLSQMSIIRNRIETFPSLYRRYKDRSLEIHGVEVVKYYRIIEKLEI